MPVWYLNEDEWGSVISSVGTATSQDLQMSYDKALLIAKKNLAAKIKSFVSLVHVFGKIVLNSYIFNPLKLSFQPVDTIFRFIQYMI